MTRKHGMNVRVTQSKSGHDRIDSMNRSTGIDLPIESRGNRAKGVVNMIDGVELNLFPQTDV